MPRKICMDKTYGQKLIHLFARLLFSGEKHSLIELSRMLECSKQSVSRMVDDITLSYSVQIEESFEGKKKYFRLRRESQHLPAIQLSTSEYNLLRMCHAFSKHLIGKQLFQEAADALDKNRALPGEDNLTASRHFATIIPGSIDYTGHRGVISKLMTALEKQLVCKVVYRKIMTERSKVFYIKPLTLFSHKETLYIHARKAPCPDKPFLKPEFDPLLAIHRIVDIEITETTFEFPETYDFEKIFNDDFGVIKEETFELTVEFTGFASGYISERIWSGDQEITQKGKGTELTFTASSIPETLFWILSFGREAKVLRPEWLVEEIKEQIADMGELYSWVE